MQKRLSPKKRNTQNNIKLWGERKEGRKGISRSDYLWNRFATDAHAFSLKDKRKELDVVRMELHKARVITSRAKPPSIQTAFWGGFLRAGWAGPSARPSRCAGHKLSLLLRVSSPVITVPQATVPSGSKMTLAWFHQVQTSGYWMTNLPISVASPFQTEPGVLGTGRAQQSL